MDGNAQNMYHGGQGYDPTAPRGMGPPPGYGAPPRQRAPMPLHQQQPQYPTYQPTDSMYSMSADQHASMSLSDITGWSTPQSVPPQPYGQPMGYGTHPQAPQATQRQPQSYRQHMSSYPQDPKQMQTAYTTQQNMMGSMIPQQGYPSIPQSQHQQQAQQRITQHYPQSGHQMYGTPPQQAPTQAYAGYGVQHQASRTATNQHPAYGHQLDQTGYGHLANQGPVGLPPIPIQQTQSHLSQTAQSHQQQQQQLHQLQHPTMNSAAQQQPVLGSTHGTQQQAQTQQSHIAPQTQHSASTMLHTSTATQQQQQQQTHQATLGAQQQQQQQQAGQQTLQQLTQGHNPASMPHQMGHSMLPSYGSQLTGTQAAVPPQVPTYLPNSKQAPATQQQQLGNSPQYRAPFPQLSPQMSPRPQMSPHPHPQMSPRPVMSPAKPPVVPTQNQQVQQQSTNNQSPHPHIPSPSARSQSSLPSMQGATVKSSIAPSNTLQALEQMVMPSANSTGIDYNQTNYRQQTLPSMPNNPLSPSPLGTHVSMSPQHQQWPPHRSQMNGSSHHNMMTTQAQLQMSQQIPQNQTVQMMGQMQMPDLMSTAVQNQQTAIQVIPPPTNQLQQQTTYSYEDMNQQQQQKTQLESIHKPYENLTPSIPSQQQQQQLGNAMSMLSPQQQQQQIEPQQDQYSVGLQVTTNQSSLSTLESTDQSSDLNLLDSYSNSATVNTSNLSSTAQKSSIDDSLLSQTTNENSQSSQISDNANSMMQTNSFNNDAMQDENANQQSTMDQDVNSYLESDKTEDFGNQQQQKSSTDNDDEQDALSLPQMQQDTGSDKIDNLEFGFGSEIQKPKSADSTMISENDKQITDELTNVGAEITNKIENIPSQSKMESGLITAYPPQQTQLQTYNMGYNLQQSPYNTMPHHQERTMIQQQLSELYTLPPSTENQEKIHKHQERITILQSHETTDQCLGGTPSCILQNPMFSMIDSPQVTSTTGRGRGRSNSSKPRKPRQKKSEKQSQAQATEETLSTTINTSNLPVSEDSVTAGTGDISQIYSEDHDMADISQDNSLCDLDTSTDASGKKIKKPRKPRAPKPPKEPKSPKESKKKREKDPDKPKKKSKKGAVSDENSVSHDNNSTEFSKHTSEGEENQSLASLMHNQNSTDANSAEGNEINEGEESKSGLELKLDDEVTDFDDIPVSKISVQSLLDEQKEKAALSDEAAGSDILSMNEDESPTKKKKSKSGDRRRSGMCKPRARKGGFGGKSNRRSNRGKIVQDSGDEADDMIATPPASPTGEDAEIDSSKRRSARNTQRKKYTDDVMLRFSDEEGGLIVSPVKQGTPKASEDIKKEFGEDGVEIKPAETTDGQPKVEGTEKIIPPEELSNKPNYVYINTSDEDTMIVQFVLASRMGKRELKPDPPPPPPVPVEVKKEETEGEVTKTEPSEMKTESSDVSTEVSAAEVKEEKSENEKVEGDEIKESESSEEKKEVESEIKADESEKEEETKMEVDEEIKEEETTTEKVSDEPTELKESSDEITKEEETPTEELPITTNDEGTTETKETVDTEEKPAEVKEEVKPEVGEVKEEKPEPVYVEVEEFLVKYRNFSYLHCEWRTEEELLKGDKRVSNKIRRFQQKQAQQFNIFENLEEDPFNPDFVEVDRILDASEHTDEEGNKNKHYLVKWKSLAYEDSTWELEEDVDEDKIEQFEKFSKLPPKNEWKFKKRPHPDQWKQLDKTPSFKGGNSLRPYQLEGLNWLKYSWYKGNNCILADEMGLGKTIQSLTFVNSVHEYGIRGPFLVIAPLSTIPNWQREFEGWTDLNVIVYHGSATSRQMLQDYELYYKLDSGKPLKDITKFNVLITTFEMIVTDYQDLSNFNFRVCVIDEAHRLKNRNCKLLEGLRQLNLEHRVLLSGTPLQNNVNELFSLLNFLEPTQFASNEDFMREFGSLRTETEVMKLQALLKPMMLRRLKDDVEKSLAPKEETIVEVELTNIQKKYYRGILEQNFSFLQKGTTAANIPNLMNTMMELRKCCIHPYLLNGAEEQIQYEWKVTHGDDRDGYYKNIVNASGKMVLIDKLLPKLKANGHRVLIFSQMVRCLDILEDYLVSKKYPFERIDGRIRGNLRQAAIDRFSKPDSDRFVFLLCTKAGGLGINLTAADTVIIYDSDWNPQNDLQAQARCHRIGQQKMVKIYRLLCRNTYEREMFDKASLKLGLDKAILQSMNTAQGKDGNNKQLSKKEIEDLLKKGAYGAVMDDDNAGDKFCEEDIDSILERRTQIITMEIEKGSTFSKASFASSSNRSDIAIDDPDFWNKWAKKAEIDPTACEKDESEDLILAEPRRRTQIKRYGHEDVMDMSEESTGLETDEEGGGIGLRSKKNRKDKLRRGKNIEDYIPRDRDTLAALGFEDVTYGSWARSECFKVEKGLLSFGWGRWSEILEQGAFKRGWKESDIEDCARIILLFCLQRYQGDEKIKTFIWDLIKPRGVGEDSTIARNHSGLHNLVPRGRRKGKCSIPGSSKEPDSAGPSSPRASSSASSTVSGLEDHHWSKDDKYDAESYLEINYKKHLTRHANKVLLRVRMLYYIKHEVIGDYVQQIQDGVPISDLPIRPPPTTDALPCSWWNPKCCDKSLLVGTYKHGCEMYRQIRADPTLCFITHCGPGDVADDSSMISKEHDDETNSKHGDVDENDEEVRSTKDGEDRPSSSGLDDEEAIIHLSSETDPNLIWPTMQDLNTRLRRVITSYQRNYKKEELKQQQKAKLQSIVPPGQSGTNNSGNMSANNPTPSTSYSSAAMAASLAQQQQTNMKMGQQSQVPPMPSAADISLLLSLGMGGLDASQLANLDLQKLAMYLKMERREKIEQVVRERERTRFEQIPKRWTRRDENEFLRVLTGYGIDLQQHTTVPMPDWSRFKTFAKLDKKTDENLSDYYKVFIAMCKRQAGEKLLEEEKGLEGIIDDIGEDHAKLILDRLELLSKLREVAKHPKLDERLKLCENNLDTPDWWESGKHDRELIRAVLKYGLYRSDQYILNDPDFPFAEAEKRYIKSLEILKSFKFDNPADLFKFAMGEIPAPVKASEKPKEQKEKVETPKVEMAKEEVKAPSEEKEIEKPTEEKPLDDQAKVEDELPKSPEKSSDVEELTVEPEIPLELTKEDEISESADEKSSEEKMEVDEKSEESTDEIKESTEEKMEVDETPKVESPEEPTPIIETEKEEIKEVEEEKDEPKIEEDKQPEPEKVDEEIEAPKSPAKVVEKSDDEEKLPVEDKTEEKPIEIKQERPEGEPKIIDTVVIDDDDTLPEKPTIEPETTSKHAAELRARFPDLEIFQPLMKLKQLDSMILKGDVKDNLKALSRVFDTSMIVRWFREFALEKRISHIIYCVEKGTWPVGKSYSAYSGCLGIDLDLPLYETVKRLNADKRSSSSTPDIITITTDHHQLSKSQLSNQLQSQMQSMVEMATKGKGKGQKRHIAIDVETERAKLHALLNNTIPIGSAGQKGAAYHEEEQEGRRSSSGGQSLQPPPAHQHGGSRSAMNQQYKPTVTIPGTSSTLTPIDLSSSLPKMRIADILRKPQAQLGDMSEVQDFSMGKSRGSGMGSNPHAQTSPTSAVGAAGKGKLNDMLSKLMKKNNIAMDDNSQQQQQQQQPEPLSKEKKRRKLDEIVMGLSASKEQKSVFGDPGLSHSSSKKPQVTPSVSVTPTNAPSQSQQQSNQKPFTITVTSVPGKSSSKSSQQSASGTSGIAALQNMSGMSSKDSMNAMILQAAQAEQQAFLKQQQKILQSIPANSPQRKAYEAMFNEMKQALELSSKLGSYGSGGVQDAKVNKWLAEQTAALTEQALNMEYLSRAAAASGGSTSQSQSQSSSRRSSSQQSHQQQQQQQQQSHQSSANSQSNNSRQRSSQSSSSNADANAMANINWNSLTGEENVSVVHKVTGKRITGRNAPQLKRLSQWLKENPMYEIDPKWTESLTMPSASTSSSQSSMREKQSHSNDITLSKTQSSSNASMNRSSSGSNQYGNSSQNAAGSSSSSSANKKQSSSSANASAAAAANMANFQSLAGLNANLLSSLPGLGGFDPKNPLASMMPFAGMPGLGSMGNMNNMNNMNLFGNLAALGGLAGMDAQSLAAVMAAASLDPTALAKSLGGSSGSNQSPSSNQSSSNKARKSTDSSSSQQQQQQQQQQSSSSSKQSSSSASQAAAQAAAANLANNPAFPFFFPNPSLLYTPLGLSGLNPYAMPGGMSAYDQLAQQCNLLNGAGMSGSSTQTTNTSSSRQASNKNTNTSSSSSSRTAALSSSSGHQQTSSPSSKNSRNSSSAMNSMSSAAARDAQLQSLLLPHDTHLLESLSRATGLDISQSNNRSSNQSSSQDKRSNAAQQANKEAMEKLERDRRKLLESLTRNGFPTDFATMQALAKMPPGLGMSTSSPSSSSKSSAKDIPLPLPADFSQALFAEMMAQTAAAVGGSSSSSSSKRAREQEMKDAFEQLSKNPVEMLARSLGVGPNISLIPTSSASSMHESKRMRQDTSSSAAAISLTPTSSKSSNEMRSHSHAHDDMKASPRSTRSNESTRDRHQEQQDKVTLTPVSAASIGASLPSQTTISLATPSGSNERTSTSSSKDRSERDSSREHNIERSSHHSPKAREQPTNLSTSKEREERSERNERSSERAENLKMSVPEPVPQQKQEESRPPPPPQQQQQHHAHDPNMDIEDLIEHSKVSKGGELQVDEQPAEQKQQQHQQQQKSDDSSKEQDQLQQEENTSDESDRRSTRRTRSKRPRSGEDMEVAVPERKRELRSSAGRLAAAAAARMAAEAKLAQQQAAAEAQQNQNASNSENKEIE